MCWLKVFAEITDDVPIDSLLKFKNNKFEKLFGYRILLAESGERGKEIDIVILDMNMPEMSGDEVFYRLTEINIFCKIIITSGLADQRILAKMRNDGLLGFIGKPYSIEQLNSLLKRILN